MTVTTYIGERYEHTHENQAFDQLCILAEETWGNEDGSYTLIGNVTCNGHELDALLIKPDALVVIDFKNFGGEVVFSENGPWRAGSAIVKGGSKTNPYKQIHANKFALLTWLKNRLPHLSADNNLGHISGLVLFQQKTNFDVEQVPPKIASWFNAGDFSTGMNWLRHLASPSIFLGAKEQQEIINELNVTRYQLPGTAITTVLKKHEDQKVEPEVTLTNSQKEAIRRYETLLSSSDPISVLSITGMVSSGKTHLIYKFVELATLAGRELVFLARNTRIANQLEIRTGQNFRSIYGHVYDLSKEIENNNSPLPFNPLRTCEDDFAAVYIIDEAQLLSDEYYELEDKRFGSGRVLSDFIEFISSNRKATALIVTIGDSYQIQSSLSFIKKDAFLSKNIPHQSVEMLDIIGDKKNNSILGTAYQLAESINQNYFHDLKLNPVNDQLIIAPDNNVQRAEFYSKIFLDSLGDSLFITFSNDLVTQITDWGRKRFLGRKSRQPESGDLLELRNKIEISFAVETEGLNSLSNQPSNDIADTFYPGTYVRVVKVDPKVIVRSVLLKGRQNETVLRFRELECLINGSKQAKILYLEDYLLADKPELDADSLIALRALAEMDLKGNEKYTKAKDQSSAAKDYYNENKTPENKKQYDQAKHDLAEIRRKLLKEDPYLNAARLRYAYASTCHHARGRQWDYVVVDASYSDQGRTNRSYFEWLYTAITRARQAVVLDKFKAISPWDQTHISASNLSITNTLKIFFTFPYTKTETNPIKSDVFNWPSGLSDDKLELRALCLFCSRLLNKENIVIKLVKQHPYQEQYFIESTAGEEAVILLHYNGSFDVTSLRAQKTDSDLAQKALKLLKLSPSFESPQANDIFRLIKIACDNADLVVEGGKEHSWQLQLSLSNADQQLANISVYYKEEGYPSKILIDKATDQAIVQQIYLAFGQSAEELNVS